jgi:hypothetical protein
MIVKIALKHPDKIVDDGETGSTFTDSTFYVHSEDLPPTPLGSESAKAVRHLVLYKQTGKPLAGEDGGVYVALFPHYNGANSLRTDWPLLRAAPMVTHERCHCTKIHVHRDSQDNRVKIPEGYKRVQVLSTRWVAEDQTETYTSLIARVDCDTCDGEGYKLLDELAEEKPDV